MLFNSGTTNLVERARFYAGDPSASPEPMFSAAEVKDAVNQVYLEMMDMARILDLGVNRKRSYVDSVADQVFYQRPTDIVRVVTMEVSTDGTNLSTSPTSPTIVFLEAKDGDTAFRLYNAQQVTTPKYHFLHQDYLGMVAPVSTAGTKAIRLYYDSETTELSGDTDEPLLPTAYRRLISMQAAILLLASKKHETLQLEQLVAPRWAQFLAAIDEPIADYHGQIPVAGLGEAKDYETKVGQGG